MTTLRRFEGKRAGKGKRGDTVPGEKMPDE
jgi:hypothetical protein